MQYEEASFLQDIDGGPRENATWGTSRVSVSGHGAVMRPPRRALALPRPGSPLPHGHAFHLSPPARYEIASPRTPPHTAAAPELGQMAAPPRMRDSRTCDV